MEWYSSGTLISAGGEEITMMVMKGLRRLCLLASRLHFISLWLLSSSLYSCCRPTMPVELVQGLRQHLGHHDPES